MAILPPENRLWWKEPLSGTEIVWIAVAFVWGLVMFGTMVSWHFVGKQNLSNEAYRIDPAVYAELTEAQAEKYKVRMEGNLDVPVSHPPPGSDVYMLGRLWEWWPVLELEKDQTYRLHLSSVDWQHGFSLQPQNINLQIHPGYDMVLTIKPDKAGEYAVVCNEFCGIGHHTMVGKIYVVDKK
ncbi:MAG: cytochrome C oxidase subunit II [Alphaproteobacteria bacterium]|jgi:cytochrome c oxidase subunit 2|nr:cytochrome C oxidase subunit II [Alphaproteobacteria bacterium]MDP6565225.1 cytochrome C oxidase subunit II [Alphaproteobacteria bacterium]MDP6812807.1 cytochrome C oxidase subunit II [Alphaproteobacteria bacterium]|tara:strand:- start:26 stop:571 length:546 start_codon:yes stop_codon:yes gene_type:complete